MKKKLLILLPLTLIFLSANTQISYAKSDQTASPSPKTNRNQIRTLATPSASPVMEQERERDKQGAQFGLANGVVTLTTPSGNTHELKLPDQAIENMQRNGFFNSPTITEEPEVTETVREKKKILGLIPVDVEMLLTIKTDTGEVTYVPKSGVLKFLSFLFTQ